MGYYIETRNERQKAEQILAKFPHTREVTGSELKFDYTGKSVLVCVYNHGPFEAAVICYSPEELRDFSRANDPRKKRWLCMSRVAVLEENPEITHLLPALQT